MNKNIIQSTALFITFIVITLPIISAQELGPPETSQQPTTELAITADIPRYYRETSITIHGTTHPNATIELFIKQVKRRETTANKEGAFVISRAFLPEKDNELVLKATDIFTRTVEKTFTITVDTDVPRFRITNFTSLATQPTLALKADTNKPINVTYFTKPISDTIAPEKIKNLRKDRIEANAIYLSWDISTALDFDEYLIYRDNKKIATSSTPNYVDTAIAKNEEYEYRISAVDETCNESPLSEVILVETLEETASTTPAQEPRLRCEPEHKTLTIEHSGTFTIPLTLHEGVNLVQITATDLAGHTVTYKNTTTLDSLPPQILETNLEQISPSYLPQVDIQGVLNKKAAIFVYINDERKPAGFTLSDDQGQFKLPITLKRDIKTNKTTQRVSLESGEGFANNIKIEAVDAAGRKSPPQTGKIVYSICGFGNWFDVKIGKPLPEKLTPRFILQGIQEAGLTFNASYRGNYEVTTGRVEVNPLVLSPEIENEYDNGIVDTNAIVQASPKNVLGYIQLMFRPVMFEDKKMTSIEKEQNLSVHRAGKGPSKGKCLTPGIGCMRFFLEIVIPFQEKIPKHIVDPRTQQTITKADPVNRVQRTCVPVEIMMDVPVPPDKIPKGFLRNAVEFLDSAVDTIDVVLKPLTTVGQYVLYACLGSTAYLYFNTVREKWNCEFAEYRSKAKAFISVVKPGEDETEQVFTTEIAQAGLCREAYGTDKDALDLCNTCQKTIENSREFEYEYLHPICDRVACPSAPTLQSHIRARTGHVEEITDINPASISDSKVKDFLVTINGKQKLYTGDDCAFGEYTAEKIPKKLFTSYDQNVGDALNIRDIYLTVKNKAGKINKQITDNDCKQYTRPAHPDCCGTSYMREWETACGAAPFADAFDELKESTCLAAQNVNKKITDPHVDCGGVRKLFNSVAGICDPETGRESIDPIPTGIKYDKNDLPASATTNEVYLLVVPEQKRTDMVYKVYRGYIAQRFTRGETHANKQQAIKRYGGIEFTVNAQASAVSDGIDLTRFFSQEKKEGKELKEYTPEFKKELCSDAFGPKIDQTSCTRNDQRIRELYNIVYEKIGASDKEYIVKPDQEGILRSAQCVCLPAVTSYLQLWRNILGATRDCFKSILLTGDGSEGVCKAVLSTYVCDMLFDVVKCFVQKFNAPGAGVRVGARGIGDFVGALTSAGSQVQQRINGRYGETALWKTMFVDRKLIHSICAFAFTGTWNFDASSLFSQTVASIPIESQAFLTPCKRQFVAFNPATQPPGKTTWVYRFGVGIAAGADVRPELLLKCSPGFTCNPADGFKNGECDCTKKGEITRPIAAPEIPQTVKKNDILNKEIYYTIQADTPDSSVRYDTAILRYTYLDPKSNSEQVKETKCSIGLSGGDAPNFCQFDPFSLSFRCQFGVGESAVKLEKVDVSYEKQTAQHILAFGIGDDIKLDLSIKQQQPLEKARSLEGKKFIFYRIKNQNDKTVAELSERDAFVQSDTIDREGSFVKPLIIPGAITPENFAPEGIRTPQFNQFILDEPGKPMRITDLVTDFITPADEQRPFVIRIEPGKTSVYRGSKAVKEGGKFVTEGEPLATDLIGLGPHSITYTLPGTTSARTVAFKLKQIPPTNADILVEPPAQEQKNPCSGEPKDRKTVPWTVEIEIHDPDRNGRPTAQISVDPTTGKQAKDTVKINAVCLPGIQLFPKKLTPAEEKEAGKCAQPSYVKNQEPCYCGQLEGKQTPNCGNEQDGNYCIANLGCSRLPVCKFASNPEDLVQEDCYCAAYTIYGPPTLNCKKNQYCCATTKTCTKTFEECEKVTPQIIPPTSLTTGLFELQQLPINSRIIYTEKDMPGGPRDVFIRRESDTIWISSEFTRNLELPQIKETLQNKFVTIRLGNEAKTGMIKNGRFTPQP